MLKRFLALAVFCLPLAGCYDYADGERIGTVIKFSQKGLLCKTWEGEMMLGGLDAGTGSMGRVWAFTVEDKRLVPEMQKSLGKQITVTYQQEWATFCRTDSGRNYFVTGIK